MSSEKLSLRCVCEAAEPAWAAPLRWPWNLAPFARRFGQIIRREMAMLHVLDPLRALSKANGDPLPLPKRGLPHSYFHFMGFDPFDLQKAEYSFM